MRHQLVTFTNGYSVPAVIVSPDEDVHSISKLLGLPRVHGSIAVVGGADELERTENGRLIQQIQCVLQQVVQVAERYRLVVIDGGISSGIMRMLGEERARSHSTFPLVGVAPLGKVAWENLNAHHDASHPLDPHHSAFVLVDSDRWGGEVDILADLVYHLAGCSNPLEIVVNGGEITKQDALAYVKKGGRLLVIQGSGRLADQLAEAQLTRESNDSVIADIISTEEQLNIYSFNNGCRDFSTVLLNLIGLA